MIRAPQSLNQKRCSECVKAAVHLKQRCATSGSENGYLFKRFPPANTLAANHFCFAGVNVPVQPMSNDLTDHHDATERPPMNGDVSQAETSSAQRNKRVRRPQH